MHYSQNFYRESGLPVGNDVGIFADDQLTCAFDSSGASDRRVFWQDLQFIPNRFDDAPRRGDVIACDVVMNSLSIVQC